MEQREIKFRGRRAELPRGWVYGYFYETPNHNYIWTIDNIPMPCQIIAGTQQQYTGLKDKSGKEVYEGDILEYNNYHDLDIYDKEDSIFAVVKYEQMSGDYCNGIGFNIVDKKEHPVYVEMSKIIGNIIENPELL